ncbi:hypothetical protein BDFB_011895 [Asbolus verrucosus]|uniref:Uncharacterized protein n=1 Tax=Asbolus verrucosus TaxID=1661398 RepID=A0A482VSM5_ASBVE|nr:hypothetical protein BDFB_011895 [Asbolus verrucosus]
MGKFSSVAAAYVHFFYGPFIFKEPNFHECSPALSSFIVVFAASCVLWSLPLYPSRLRKLFWPCNWMVQYLTALYLLEFAIGKVWVPLETAVINLPVAMASFLENYLGCQDSCGFLKSRGAGVFCSYSLSALILLATLHSTRIINLRLLSDGITPFMWDITRRVKRCFRKVSDSCGIPALKKASKRRKVDFCDTDTDDIYELDPSDALETTDVRDCYPHYHFQ